MKAKLLLFIVVITMFSSCGRKIDNKQIFDDHNSSEVSVETTTSIENNDMIMADSLAVTPIMEESTSDISESVNEIHSVPKETVLESSIIKNDDVDVIKIDEAESEIKHIMAPIIQGGGSYSVLYKSIENADQVIFLSENTDGIMVSASLIKIFVAGAVYEKIDDIRIFDSYDGETNHLLDIMISQSDNDACNKLVSRLGNGDSVYGMQVVNEYCISHGFDETHMNRLMLDFNGIENYTSVKDCSMMLESIYNDSILGSKEILKFMKNQHTLTKIPAGISSDITIANKTGELSNVENDVAIVYDDKKPYILCVMTNNLVDTYLARKCIKSLSSYLYKNA